MACTFMACSGYLLCPWPHRGANDAGAEASILSDLHGIFIHIFSMFSP